MTRTLETSRFFLPYCSLYHHFFIIYSYLSRESHFLVIMLISSLFCCIFIVAEPERIPFQKPKTPQAFSSNPDAIGNNKPVDTVLPKKERAENSVSFAGDLMLNVHEEKETATSVDVEKGIESPGRKKESIVGEKGVNYEMKNDEEKGMINTVVRLQLIKTQ